MRNRFFKGPARLLSVWAIFLGCLPCGAWAGPVPSSLGDLGSAREADILRIEQMLADGRVVKVLARRGIEPDELRRKLEKMSDREIHMLALRLENVKSGGQITGILIIILLVILIVYFLDRGY